MRGSREIAILVSVSVMCAIAHAASASTQQIQIVDDPSTPSTFAFAPNPYEVLQGNDIEWNNQTSEVHTATSDQGFFRQEILGGATSGLVLMAWSGRYRYHCEIHPDMKGTIDNGLLVSDPAPTRGATIQVFWASTTIPAGQDMDVQVKRPGDTRFRAFKMNQTGSELSGDFVIKKRGTYKFRVRRQFTGTNKASAYEVSRLFVS